MAASIMKVEKICQIVQLKQMIRRWRDLSLCRRSRAAGGSSIGSGSNRPVRPGFLAVYVGLELERRRFVIPTRFLNLPLFTTLLERAEEEYGFQPAGGLALPCDPVFFGWVIDALYRDEGRFKSLGFDAMLALFSDLGGGGVAAFACKEMYNGFSPLLPKTRA